MTFDFDTKVSRAGTASLKYDARQQYFGRDDVVPLWVADMDFPAPEAVTKALVARAEHGIFGYTDYPESVYESLQWWFRRRHQWKISRESILFCPGVVPSLYAAVTALTQPKDKVIIQTPVYHPFFTAVTDTGRTLLENRLILDNGEYRMDLAHMRRCAEDGAKVLILCSPHNPIGRVWRQDELLALLDVVREYDMTVISDEIHADLIFPQYQHYPLASLADDVNVITAVSPSKTFNIPGLGLSAMIATDPEQHQAIQTLFQQWHINNTNPFSIVGFEAAYQHGEAWLEALMVYLDETRRVVAEYCQTHMPMIKVEPSQGTYLLWLDCRGLGMSDDDLHQFFIEQAKVAMSPGTLFGEEAGAGFMRLNIAAPRSLILSALDAMKAAYLAL